MVQAMVPPPFAIRALWALQYFPMQLLSHTSTDPKNSHSQLFVPLILTYFLCIYTKFFFKYNFLLLSSPHWVPVTKPKPKPNRRPDMQNWGPSACRCGMFFVQGGPEPPSAKWEHENCRVYEKCLLHMKLRCKDTGSRGLPN